MSKEFDRAGSHGMPLSIPDFVASVVEERVKGKRGTGSRIYYLS